MRPATVVMWLGNAVHLPLSWVLIFGVAGSPAPGIQGAALAESMTLVLHVVGLVGRIRRATRPACMVGRRQERD